MTITLIFSAKRFSWNGNNGMTEASDLLGSLAAPKEKFYVEGKQDKLLFSFNKLLRDGEGDLQGWVFQSEDNKFKITIYND